MQILKLGKKRNEYTDSKNNGVVIEKLKPEYKIVEEYWVNPFAQVTIARTTSEGYEYFVKETELTAEESEAREKLVSIISKELEAPEELESDVLSYIFSEAQKAAQRYKRSLGKFSENSWRKILYYVV
ncbi:MAG: hypothetical protein QXH91_06020, partial [Candidatus Bathyarchaeia archaeon]